MTPIRHRLAALLLVLSSAASPLTAQQDDLAALKDRLDPGSFRVFAAMLDSARTAGLPAAPLISKAQEGLLKRAAPNAIIAASRGLLVRMRQSRDALGSTAGPAELEAGASALRAGATTSQLAELRTSRGGKGIAVPLVVLADLLARGVPRDTAARALQAMAAANATDAAFNALRLSIERDISGGMLPATAAGIHYRAALGGRQP
ncbi:MAG: hypothetical protein U5K74_16165 [Gemmatimonadaceae bacterium]|nr:hypothetical protein [Gemmatimonadaceae bacterium]